MMKKLTWTTAIFVAAAATWPAIGLAETASITGELVTVMCYTGHGEDGRGAKHQACALKCAKEGYPLAVLTDEGTLYKVTGKLTADNNRALHELITKKVVATGDVGRDGDDRTIEAASVEPAK